MGARISEYIPPAPPPTLMETVRDTAAKAIGANEPWCRHREAAIEEYIDGMSNSDFLQLLSFAIEEMRR